LGAQPVERGLDDWLKVIGVAVNLGDCGDQVEDLLEREVLADFVGTLRGV
jgi:hypothetical protein